MCGWWGVDALSFNDRLRLEAARSLREDYLQQNAFDEVDTYTSMKKQAAMLRMVLAFYDEGMHALDEGADYSDIIKIGVREEIAQGQILSRRRI